MKIESLEGEIWKDVVGYEGLYQVSNMGRIKSLPRDVVRAGAFKKKTESLLSPRKKQTTDAGIFFSYTLNIGYSRQFQVTISHEQLSAPEAWAAVESSSGRYQVSSHGRIKSIATKIDEHPVKRKGRLLSPHLCSAGYKQVPLSCNGKAIICLLHRIVAESFIPNPENKPQINHINGIKTDNRVSNLEWVSSQENIIHSIRTGRKKGQVKRMPVYQYSIAGEFMGRFESSKAAARAIGAKTSAYIRSCAAGKGKTAYGFIWAHEPKHTA